MPEAGAFETNLAPGLRIETHTGQRIVPLLPVLAELRTLIFRDWPYLYDGDPAYERGYLRTYAESAGGMLAVAYHGKTVIGASTCLPMREAAAEIWQPLAARGLDPARFCYFGESVLLPAYRKQGLGVRFFAAREAHALSDSACAQAMFYSVRRPPDHPARPPDAQPLDAFWRHRGYRPVEGLSCTMQWKEVGMDAQTPHTLDAWSKPLRHG